MSRPFSTSVSEGFMRKRDAERYAVRAGKAGYVAEVKGPTNWFTCGARWWVYLKEAK